MEFDNYGRPNAHNLCAWFGTPNREDVIYRREGDVINTVTVTMGGRGGYYIIV